jgi:uncharacterized protein with GYD domain
MPKYLVQASYTVEGTKGLIKEGGTSRRTKIAELAKSLGGKLEAFYFAFGESDVYSILEAPDSVTASAMALAINASGAVTLKTIALITPEEVDQATKKIPAYRAPGA